MKFFYAFIVAILMISPVLKSQDLLVSGELIVMLTTEASPTLIEQELSVVNQRETQLTFKKELSHPMRTWLVSFNTASVDARSILRTIQNHPDVLLAQFNHRVSMRNVPDDPLYTSQWQYDNDGSNGGVIGADIDADLAWDITNGGLTIQGDTIVVAVLDNGVDTDHSDWGNNLWINHDEIPDNGIDDDENGYIDDYRGWNISTDSDQIEGGSHGTPVAGIVGAQGNNGNGVAGVNWNVKLMIIHNSFNTNEAAVIEAYTYPLVQRKRYNSTNGQEGAFVVATNASWGIDMGQPDDAPIWCAFYDTLGTYGILNCGATANANFDIDEVGDLPTACPSDYMISVTNMNNQDLKVNGAGYGLNTIDLGAFGQGTYTMSNGNGYGGFGGTSGATPHVTGAVALLYSAPCYSLIEIAKADPSQAALMIKNAILNGTDPNESLEGITVTGGRLNLKNALDELLEGCSNSECIAPYNLIAEQIDSLDYLLSWDYISDTVNFNLEFKLADDDLWTEVSNFSGQSFLLENLLWCADYQFRVQAICSDTAISDYSGIYMFTSEGCCQAPENLTVLAVTDSSVTFSWDPVFAASFYLYEVSADGFSQSDTSFLEMVTLSNLDSCKEYVIKVGTICEDTVLLSSEVLFNTTGCGGCLDYDYCIPEGISTEYEWIESFGLGDNENESGDNSGYALFSDLEWFFEMNKSHDFTIEPGFAAGAYNEYYRIWVDLDQNGSFDEDELLFDSGSAVSGNVEGSIFIPGETALGLTRLRVAMQYQFSMTACESFSVGEVEDYCVFFDAFPGIQEKDKTERIALYPNPTQKRLTIECHDTQGATMIIYDLQGQQVFSGRLNGGTNAINLEGIPPGSYLLRYSFSDQTESHQRLLVIP